MSRAYQQTFVDEMLPNEWKKGHTSVLLALPVGGGKTRCARLVVSKLAKVGGWDCWILDHRKELTEQFSEEFREMAPAVYWAGKPSPKPHWLRIAGRDTLIRRDWQPTPSTTKCLVITDEAHHAAERNTYGKLYEQFRSQYKTVYMLGLTATPYRLDGKPLDRIFTSLIEPVTPGELIDSGILMEPRVIGADAPNLADLHIQGGDFAASELEMRSRKLVGNVVEEWKRWSDGYPGVLRAVSIAHSKELCERLRAAGFRAEHMDGATPAHERNALFARLAIGGQRGAGAGIDILCQVDVASEGWNPPSDYERVLKMPELWPSADRPPPYVPLCVLSDCRPTLSRSGYRQFEGRGSRPMGDKISTSLGPLGALPKPWFRLISHSKNYERFGFLRDHHTFDLNTGSVGGESRQPRQKDGLLSCRYCPACLSVWPTSMKDCPPPCGSALSTPPPPVEETTEKLAPLGATVDATPKQRVGYLTSLWISHRRKNEQRAAQGKPPISENQIRAIFHSYSGRWPTKADMDEAKRASDGKIKK